MGINKKILYVVNVDWFFLSHRLPIALEALANGYDVHILTTITDGKEDLIRHGFTIHKFSGGRGVNRPIDVIKQFLEIRYTIKLVQPDLIHLVTVLPVLLGGINARFQSVKGVVVAISGLGTVFIANSWSAKIRRYIVERLYKLALNNPAAKVIFQNPYDRTLINDLVSLESNQLVMIPGSGVDLDIYSPRPLPGGRPIVMLAARLLREKGVFEFLHACEILKNDKELQSIEPRYVLVGKIDLENPSSLTSTEINEISNSGLVEVWGLKTDIPDILAQASIVVLPSYREGLPKILIEAAACGRPVIATDVPGCRDAIRENLTGLVVPVKDAQALSQAILELLNNPQKAQAMGKAGRKLAEEKFDVREVVRQHLAIYNSLLK